MKTESIDRVPLGAPGLHLGIELRQEHPAFVCVAIESRWFNRLELVSPDQADRLALALQAAALKARTQHGAQR